MKFLKYTAFLGIFLMVGCSQTQRPQSISEQPAPLTEQETAGKKLTPELLWKFGRIGEYKVSPDNSTVVYTVSRYSVKDNKGRTTIWSIPAKGGEPVCLTADVAASAFNPRWNPLTGHIAYLTAASGDVQIWDMKPDGSDKRQASKIDGGINGFEFSPKGEKLLFLKDVPAGESPQKLYPDLPKSYAVVSDDMMYRHWNDWTDYAVSHIFVASTLIKDGYITGGKDIMEGEPFDAPLAPYFDSDEIAFSPDGKYIAYTCKKLTGREYTLSTNSDIYLYDTETDVTINISEGMPGYDKYPVFSPDGSMIAFQSMATPGFEADKERLMLYSLAQKGKIEELTSDFSDNAAHFVWTPDNKGIWFISGVRATYQVYHADIASKNITPVTIGKHDYTSINLADNELIGSKMSMSMATELFAVNPQTGEERQLTFVNQNIYNAIRISEVKERTVKTTDGKDMLVWVIYPPDFDATKKYPAVLFCEGGPQSAVSQFFSYRWNFQLMAANGYIIVAPNRRGLPTFGEEWNRQISGDYGGQNMRDYLSAIDDVAKEPYVDAARLGAVGASYGGFSVYWLAGHHQKRFKAFIAHCGMFNFESQYGGTDEYWFPNFDLEGAYWDKPRPKSYDFSPHLSVDQWDTPILVIHGGKDFRVPYTEGLQAFSAAQLRGVPSRLLIFPEESHWVLSPQNAILWQREFFGWLDKWLKN
ncbi:MAG: S9 family peptidase [Bacteroidales bacterium]|jgi:dipeptidyl aminopeptidase/acylaminoacyl peptidase|nr:S9 family peptidase [Bacteroidales bacterium]